MKKILSLVLVGAFLICGVSKFAFATDEDPNKNILKQGILGAITGGVAAKASGGKAGKGALIGAGTNVIGGALLDTLTGPSQSQSQQPQYVQAAPQYVEQQPVYYQQAPVQQQQYAYPQQQQGYGAPPGYQAVVVQEPVQQEDPNKKILKQGLLGAGVGAISASASGGKAGKGALIGAGTNVIGGALLDTLTGPSQPQTQQKVYYQPIPQAPVQQYQQGYAQQQAPTPKKKIIRSYDKDGNVTSETEVWE